MLSSILSLWWKNIYQFVRRKWNLLECSRIRVLVTNKSQNKTIREERDMQSKGIEEFTRYCYYWGWCRRAEIKKPKANKNKGMDKVREEEVKHVFFLGFFNFWVVKMVSKEVEKFQERFKYFSIWLGMETFRVSIFLRMEASQDRWITICLLSSMMIKSVNLLMKKRGVLFV